MFKRAIDLLEKPKVFFILLLLVSIPIFIYGLNKVVGESDEYIYYYMAYATSQGKHPYVDYFCAHMPLMIYPLALLYSIFGVSITLGKLVPLVSFFLTCFFTYLIGEKYRKHAGILACMLLLLSPLVHPYLRSMYGVFLCLAIGLAAYYFHLSGRKTLSGFLTVLMLFARLNIWPLAVLIYLLNRREKDYYKGLLFASPLLVFLFIPNFIDNTILYHLSRRAYTFWDKIGVVGFFLMREWFLVAMTATSALLFYFNGKVKDLGKLIKGLKFKVMSKSTLAAIILVLFLFITIGRSVYSYYYIFLLPFMAVFSALGMLDLRPLKQKEVVVLSIPPLLMFLLSNETGLLLFTGLLFTLMLLDSVKKDKKKIGLAAIVVGLILIQVAFNYEPITVPYADNKVDSYDQLIEYVKENTLEESDLFYLGPGNAYVALSSNRELAGEFIDITDEHFYWYSSRMDARIVSILEGKPELVVLELRHLNDLMNKGVNLTLTLDLLHSEYIPIEVFYEFDLDRRRPLVVWEKKGSSVGELEIQAPVGMEERRFFERYLFYYEGEARMQDKLDVKVIDVSQPYVPESLRGENAFGLTLVPEKVFNWPIKEGDHVVIEHSDSIKTEIWIASIRDDSVKAIIETYTEGKILSFTVIDYNLTSSSVDDFLCLSVLSDRIVDGFIPTYQQTGINEVQYDFIIQTKKNLEDNLITKEKYTSEVKYITENRNIGSSQDSESGINNVCAS